MCLCASSLLAGPVSKEQIKGLDEQVQDIKTDVLEIATQLNLLEEKLLFPSNTQVSLFVSLSGGDRSDLDAVEIEIDGKPVAHHIYSFKELQALQSGGMQHIYTGNIRTGEHVLKVAVKGGSTSGKELSEQASYTFNKGVGPGLVEIRFDGTDTIHFVDR